MSVATIPSDVSFVRVFARYLLDEIGVATLPSAQVFLPTRRSRRALQTAFLQETAGRALLLPRLSLLGQIEEEALAFEEGAAALAEIPPAIAPMRRWMMLTKLVQKKDNHLSLDQAADLATALASLIDQVQIEGADFANLEKLVPEELAEHWAETVRFLKIVTAEWPEILKRDEGGALDPADRRNKILDAQIEKWNVHPPQTPVFVAGSTGSIPAVARFMDCVRQLPRGMVVLPGLDPSASDEDGWQDVDETHPHYTMKRLLELFGVKRDQVLILGKTAMTAPNASRSEIAASPATFIPYIESFLSPSAKIQGGRLARNDEMAGGIGRVRLLREAMRPAATTQKWRDLTEKDIPRSALEGFSSIALDNEQEEASVIALRLRAALEDPAKTALFVTPDRVLAMRVCALLQRWGIEANDSAGTPLYASPVGSFLNAVLDAAAPEAKVVDSLSLLKHPMAACGQSVGACRARARTVEKAVWRGIAPSGGWRGASALLKDEDLAKWVGSIADAISAFQEKGDEGVPLSEWIERHSALAETLATTDELSGADRLWIGAAGEVAATWLSEWKEATGDFDAISGADYAALFRVLMRSVSVPSAADAHPRINILGVLEARLQSADLVILGGMNEGTWPAAVGIDPWLSRPMQKDFGLPLPERRIGMSAHDFVQLAARGEVLMTRAKRVNGQPTVPSRFLLQIDAVLQALGYATKENDVLAPSLPWRDWARLLDEPTESAPCSRPEPCPPVSKRPTRLSVTEISKWKRNPYAIYARRILNLEKLEPVDAALDARTSGNLMHKALEIFVRQNPDFSAADALDGLIRFGRDVFAPYMKNASVAAFWWPKFMSIADEFLRIMRARQEAGVQTVGAEVAGEMPMANGSFAVRGSADRVDRMPDGSLTIIDYKTGLVPSETAVKTGYEPQLTLLAAMAMDGFLKGVAPSAVSQIAYWSLVGKEEGIKETVIKGDMEELIAESRAQLEELIEAYKNPAMTYSVTPRAAKAMKHNDYEHLSRVQEWSVVEEGDE